MAGNEHLSRASFTSKCIKVSEQVNKLGFNIQQTHWSYETRHWFKVSFERPEKRGIEPESGFYRCYAAISIFCPKHQMEKENKNDSTRSKIRQTKKPTGLLFFAKQIYIYLHVFSFLNYKRNKTQSGHLYRKLRYITTADTSGMFLMFCF